jgi:hypothetical protein
MNQTEIKMRTILITLCLTGVLSSVSYTKAEPSFDERKVIKTFIDRMKTALEIDIDSFPALISEVETSSRTVADAPSTAILHSMAAEMYHRYYQHNRRTIDRRTPLEGFVPDDIREWTSNLFSQKIKEEIAASLLPAEALRQTPVSLFSEALETGKDSPHLRPTLYDFLAHRAIEIQPSEALYEDLLAFRRSQPDGMAALMVELDYLQFRNESLPQDKQDIYEAALDSLLNVYANEEYAVEIAHAKLQLLQRKRYRDASPDSVLTIEYRLCQDILARFPRYERIGVISNRLAAIEEQTVAVESNHTVYPGKNLELKLRYTNLANVSVSLYQGGKKIEEIPFTLPLRNSYTSHDTTLSIPVRKPGLYEYDVTSPGSKLRVANEVSVSRLAAVSRTTPSGETELLVTDYLSGKPLNEVTVNYYGVNRRTPQLLGSVKTDANGLALIPSKENVYACRPWLPEDEASPMVSIYARGYQTDTKVATEVRLLTDRGVYRPGQTLFFKGIAYINDKDNPQVAPDKRFEVVLRDANYKEVATQSFTTNSFGSFSGEFSLPGQTLTGTFTLSTLNTSVNIQVEEYKRPTFRIELPSVEEDVAFGDEVSIRGKAQTFSGAALTEGEVAYRVIRRPFLFRMYYEQMREEQVAEGRTSVGSDGAFSFIFRPEKSHELSLLAFQSYEIITTLTDSKGETQEARTLFSAGDRSIVLSSNLPAKVDKDTTAVEIAAHTLNGNPLPTHGDYAFYLLEETAKEGEYKEGRKLSEGTFATGNPLSKGILPGLPSGRIRLHLSAIDTKGRTVEEQQDFILYSRNDKRPPVRSHTWLLTDRNDCLPGEEAEICFGTSDREVYLLYELFSNGKNVARRRVMLSDENRAFRVPFLDSYGEGVIASFTFVKEGKLHTEQTTILRKRPDRTLTIKPETFRDKALPGSRESWTFRVSDAQSFPAIAEVAAGMYDASLDNIHPFAWYFAPQPYAMPYYRPFRESEGLRPVYGSDAVERKEKETPPFTFDRLNWQGALDFPVPEGLLTRNKTMMMAAAPHPAQMEVQTESDEAIFATGYGIPSTQEVLPEAGGQATPPPYPTLPLRSNFNETAFFFPSLLTDKEGRIVVNFTLPESNTTWKLQTLAHTADLKYGVATHQLVTQKPLMTLPNLPRFLRQGDQANVSTQIINLSEKETSGHARLELFDPSNDQPILPASTPLPFTLPAGGTTTLSWPVSLPEATGLVGCRIIADSEAGSDGEQHLIPVLPDEILVTESIPFYLTDEREKQVEIKDAQASSTRRLQRMTVELSSDPVWYAVHALPAIAHPRNDDAVSWFNAYYSQTLAASIARSNPRIRSVIDQWEAQKETSSTLLSNLEQNEELKNILLEETPWTLDAQTETEQKQRLSLLFDVNRASYQRETAMRELLRQQHEEGGWGWFKGFYPNRSITLYILDGMAKLTQLSAATYNQQEKEMHIKALNYLDNAFRKDYERIRKANVSPLIYRPAYEQLLYACVRSAYRDVPQARGAGEAIRYYTEQAEKQWTKASLYEKGLIALLMHRNGKDKVAKDILAWLRKTATTSAEKGMYWANNRGENNFFVSPIDVHSLLMSVFRTLGTDTVETDRMKQWLLSQKRTQNWEPTPSTANAIYSLLTHGTDWLAETNNTTIQWGDKTLHAPAGATATGYIKETLSGKDITPALHTLTLRKEGKSPAWGAIYYQYFKSIGKINKQGGALSVEKRHISPEGVDKPLKVGDKVIVRLTIRADRDMEYVCLKDLRAGCFEPAVQRSGIRSVDGLICYHSPKDVSENFFFDRLPAGTYVLEYTAYVSRSGQYAGGMATLQCLYAPEFISHTEGNVIIVSQ